MGRLRKQKWTCDPQLFVRTILNLYLVTYSTVIAYQGPRIPWSGRLDCDHLNVGKTEPKLLGSSTKVPIRAIAVEQCKAAECLRDFLLGTQNDVGPVQRRGPQTARGTFFYSMEIRSGLLRHRKLLSLTFLVGSWRLWLCGRPECAEALRGPRAQPKIIDNVVRVHLLAVWSGAPLVRVKKEAKSVQGSARAWP